MFCYAVVEDAFFTVVYRKIVARASAGHADVTFEYSREQLHDAIANYKGPYGRVGLVEEDVQFDCKCAVKHDIW